MKILYDSQAFGTPYGGLARYFYELLKNLRHNGKVHWELAIRYSRYEPLKDLFPDKAVIENWPDLDTNVLGIRNFCGKGTLGRMKTKFSPQTDYSAENRKLAMQKIRRGGFDVFHPTYYEPYFLENLGEKPFVLTVDDMRHEVYPEYYELDNPTTLQKKRLIEKAAGIIAISEFTRNELVKIFGIAEDRITVIHLANSLNPASDSTALNCPLPKKYILFVGSRKIYKNFYFFVRATTRLLLNDPELNIICTGNRFAPKETAFFDNLGIGNRILHYPVDDKHLSVLYRNALAFVFPSLYEGFGLPILEAFGCRCPVILSRAGSLPEIGGDAAVYFEPKSVSELREAVSGVIYNRQKCEELIQKGTRRLAHFSWEKNATETKLLYEKIIGER